MIQWPYILFFGTIVVLVVMMASGVVMTSEGAERILEKRPKGRLLYWLGGPMFGLAVSGAFLGLIFQGNVITMLFAAAVLSALMWVICRFTARI